jgi:hypothetical protein
MVSRWWLGRNGTYASGYFVLLEFHGFGWMNAWGASADAVGQSKQI